MLKNLRFNHSENSMRLVPRRLESQLVDDGDGVLRKTKPIVRDGYKAVPDDADRQKILVKKEDVPFVVEALRWRTGQSEVNFSTVRFEVDKKTGQSKIIPQTGEIIEIRLPGNFTPALTTEDISEIVADYKLLGIGKRFPVYQDILKKRLAENALQEGIIAFLLDTQREIIAGLKDKKKITPMPAWISRVLELRAGTSKTGSYDWE